MLATGGVLFAFSIYEQSYRMSDKRTRKPTNNIDTFAAVKVENYISFTKNKKLL